jgi:hypothetical protein
VEEILSHIRILCMAGLSGGFSTLDLSLRAAANETKADVFFARGVVMDYINTNLETEGSVGIGPDLLGIR